MLSSHVCRQAVKLTHAWSAGFQLVDGKERMIVVEGLADGAMQRMQDIALQALTGSMPQPNATCRRAVHWHKDLRSVLAHEGNEVYAVGKHDGSLSSQKQPDDECQAFL